MYGHDSSVGKKILLWRLSVDACAFLNSATIQQAGVHSSLLWIMILTSLLSSRFYSLSTYARVHLSPLNLIGCQDDDPGILLPDHFPEVIYCCWQTALCGDVPPLWPRYFTTDVTCIDVVRAHNSRVRVFENNTCVVNCEERSGCACMAIQQ